ncbi:MAG: RNA methyltransferase [Candidatus Spechtbacteria bacterium SB0662_bin_43]|uniref:RNA methyltransferase n=1 Tax=Candidatus Spechtbacteria bacterium SB0662_bin_43 TaxID=2604897 RepID=A0A845D9E0_9BACT|nr:RNA methyltransferase [Candidatus Spechtbacteria bacterium SB0662_bin_43]
MIALLENIRSMHNVGSVFRTCDGVGVKKVYLCGYTPAPVHEILGHKRPQIEKVALGSTDTVAWEKVSVAWRLVERLKKEKYTIMALEQSSAAVSLDTVSLSKGEWDTTVLVVGNEIEGVSKPVLKRADTIVDIPMLGAKRSLNVSVAFGVAVYTLLFSIKREEG